LTYIIWDNFYGIRVNIPGPTPWPIVGNLPNIGGTKNAAETFMKLQKKHFQQIQATGKILMHNFQ
jgi:hypothetical protein